MTQLLLKDESLRRNAIVIEFSLQLVVKTRHLPRMQEVDIILQVVNGTLILIEENVLMAIM
jgi:hypothetical protein